MLILSFGISFCQIENKEIKGRPDSAVVTNKNSKKWNLPLERVKLQGEWFSKRSRELLSRIQGDSIHYYRHNVSYKYRLIKDTMIIYFSDWVYRGYYQVKGDTLISNGFGIPDTMIRWRRKQ